MRTRRPRTHVLTIRVPLALPDGEPGQDVQAALADALRVTLGVVNVAHNEEICDDPLVSYEEMP